MGAELAAHLHPQLAQREGRGEREQTVVRYTYRSRLGTNRWGELAVDHRRIVNWSWATLTASCRGGRGGAEDRRLGELFWMVEEDGDGK